MLDGTWRQWGRFKQRWSNCIVETFFPVTPEVNPRPTLSTKTEIASSLPLQILLFYNMLYSIVWAGLFFAVWVWKTSYAYRSDLWVGWMFGCTVLIEIIRLGMGYEGNLHEQVADVSGFWLLSFVKIGFTLFFLTGQYLILPIDYAINFLMLLFDMAGLVFGYIATRHMIKSESTRFYMNQLWSESEENERGSRDLRMGGSPRKGASPHRVGVTYDYERARGAK